MNIKGVIEDLKKVKKEKKRRRRRKTPRKQR